MEKPIIKSFEIEGLFGTDNVLIPFNQNVKILIGENGIGKTQVLNIFYYTLTQNYFRLSECNFQSIKLTFHNDTCIEITKKQIDEYLEEISKVPIVKDFINEFGFAQFEFLRNKFFQNKKKININEGNYLFTSKMYRRFPIVRLYRIFEELPINKENQTVLHLDACKSEITTQIDNFEIMYFPTFRRVEEDLHSLGYNEEELSLYQGNPLIQFGMDDVQKRFNNIENTIDRILKEGFTQFTTEILNVVVDESEPNDINFLEKINESDIELILSRVGNFIPTTQKEAIKSIVANKQQKNPLSGYLLQKLIDIYEKQKELDNSVKVFRDACNKYLINKKVFYDESAIKINIISEKTKSEISLNKLSSGEKQIISMFSKVYLSNSDKRFIILFDEPELSLSTIWQRQLLPDILNSKKCDFLLAVTHSPFIFENELDQYAVGLSEYFN